MDYIGAILQKNTLKPEEYEEIAIWCSKSQLGTIEDRGSYYEVIAIQTNNEEETLLQEKAGLEYWLQEHDYIGTKIATGRATVADYADIIEEMKAKANRINEIDSILGLDTQA